ncbi:Fe2+-enterobactin ABC transporter substrate-binding protein [Nocardiopsis algeriensis]|uniref:Iron complex transport system substrate-binding protein n=1 Tax=Nocardiopsis algeriensis TaxID=1478215 RepID=A0A841INE5_9ACTN|nr:Fe2+-enterobactin ABC transporter substrate-binding protein [Nocardiopsis algeriensis]MBB6118235.1 iron complex transport system substrate-binding protein [Nocardiopsis algeriensis]
MQKAISSHTVAVLGAGAALLLSLTACGTGGGDSAQEAPASAEETRAVTHLYGETDIPAEPQSVVSVSVTSTSVLLSLDVPVVASSTTSPNALTDDKGFFAQWAEVADERGVEALSGPEIDLEEVANAAPDLIVGNGYGADMVSEEMYEQLSQIAPTVVQGESDMSWLELTDRYAQALDREDRAEEIAAEYEELVAETSAQLSTEHGVAVLTGTPNGFNLFTSESAQGRFVTDLGLTLAELPASAQASSQGGARSDIVELSTEDASDMGDSTLLFVNTQGQEVEDYLETAPNLEKLDSWKDGRVFTLGATSFRMDHYSVPLMAERLVEVLGS